MPLPNITSGKTLRCSAKCKARGDVVYINGDHNLPTRMQLTEQEGGEEKKEVNIRQIEPEFLSRMFDVADA